MRGRIRTIKPEVFLDELLWELAEQTALPILQGFAGLWCYADREGRFEWRPRALKAVILPYWSGDFERILDALASAGRLIRYEVDGRVYGLVVNLGKHQAFNHREPASELPGPPAGGESHPGTPGHAREEGNGRERERKGKGTDPERARPIDSGTHAGPDPEPATITFLPEGWEPAPAFVAEATVAGITPGELGEAVKYWAGRKLGGEWRSPEAFFRGKFASLRTRAEKVRFAAHQERSSPGARASPAPESVRATGWGQHLPSEIVEFAVKHALDAHKTAGTMLRSGELDRVMSHAEANRLLAKRLGAEAKAARGKKPRKEAA